MIDPFESVIVRSDSFSFRLCSGSSDLHRPNPIFAVRRYGATHQQSDPGCVAAYSTMKIAPPIVFPIFVPVAASPIRASVVTNLC